MHPTQRFHRPTITLTGADERTPMPALAWLACQPQVEIGLLYSATPAGRPRYPSRMWLAELPLRLPVLHAALHVCGSTARAQLRQGTLEDLTAQVLRIQINGTLAVAEVEALCAQYPRHVIITQHHTDNAALLGVQATNHAVLVDGSGGRGISPERWRRPPTTKPVGFAGGLGPDNLATQLPRILSVAPRHSWVDMESSLRTSEDWFDVERARASVVAFNQARAEYQAALSTGQGITA